MTCSCGRKFLNDGHPCPESTVSSLLPSNPFTSERVNPFRLEWRSIAGVSGLAGWDGAAIGLDDESWVFADIKLFRAPRRLRLKANAYCSRLRIVGDSCPAPPDVRWHEGSTSA
jgi:hypothetical protein